VYTAEEVDKYVQGYAFARAKDLFLKNSNGFYLVVIDKNKRLDMKQLRQIVHGNRLKFASDANLTNYLGIYSGAVSPMNLINNQDRQVTVIFDQDIVDHHDQIGCHPNTNQ
jgi:Ala-tRNA(Pro) deacylase